MKSKFLQKIRDENPLIHNMTNIVAAQFSANGLLALGASPLVSDNIAEVAEIQNFNKALVINIGTLFSKAPEAMICAGQAANKNNIPVVLDPVGVSATSYRTATVDELLKNIKFTLIKGNACEMAHLAGQKWKGQGVDAQQNDKDARPIAKIVAEKYNTIAAISGEIDIISDGKQTASIKHGTPMLSKITASGCLLSAFCAAFLSVAPKEEYFNAVCEALLSYALAGEIAAQPLKPYEYGQFLTRFIDQIGALTAETIAQGKIEINNK